MLAICLEKLACVGRMPRSSLLRPQLPSVYIVGFEFLNSANFLLRYNIHALGGRATFGSPADLLELVFFDTRLVLGFGDNMASFPAGTYAFMYSWSSLMPEARDPVVLLELGDVGAVAVMWNALGAP